MKPISGTFSARLDGAYQGDLFTNAENTSWAKIPGRFLANGRLTWTTEDDAWKVSLEVLNLFDKYYFQTVSDITTSLGLVTGSPGCRAPGRWRSNGASDPASRSCHGRSGQRPRRGRGLCGPRPFRWPEQRNEKRPASRGPSFVTLPGSSRQTVLRRSRISLPGLK
jgi:hypothetical protein